MATSAGVDPEPQVQIVRSMSTNATATLVATAPPASTASTGKLYSFTRNKVIGV